MRIALLPARKESPAYMTIEPIESVPIGVYIAEAGFTQVWDPESVPLCDNCDMSFETPWDWSAAHTNDYGYEIHEHCCESCELHE